AAPFSVRLLELDRGPNDSASQPGDDGLASLLPASFRTESNDVVAASRDAAACVEQELDLKRLDNVHSWLWVADRPMPPRPAAPAATARSGDHASSGDGDVGSHEANLKRRRGLRKRALGFLFSYAALISRESDFRIATDKQLLPPGIKWPEWRVLVEQLGTGRIYPYIDRRFHHGELYLARKDTRAADTDTAMRRHRPGAADSSPTSPTMADSYSTKGLPPAPAVSVRTVPMAGLLVDVYGLDELPPDPATPVTCLWLLHPRTRTRARMADIARRVLHAWLGRREQDRGGRARGLVALAFDMPNHGSRLVSERANQAWDGGNERHAIDLAGLVGGARADMSALMDLVGGYLEREVDGHVALGWSLGGHAAWQGVVCEERLDAAVVVVGCPDYLGLMTDRAKRSDLDTGSAPLLGSRFFPRALLSACCAHDPRAILFGPGGSLPSVPLPAAEQARLRSILDARVRGKKVLLCSGGDDALVPHALSRPLLAVLKDAARGWYRDGGFVVDDRVYEGVGHRFSKDMVRDAVEFLVSVVGEGPRPRGGKEEEEEKARI
ncbi:Uncharacterized protein TCAP_02534, partial [Tolypocladium capitatum]